MSAGSQPEILRSRARSLRKPRPPLRVRGDGVEVKRLGAALRPRRDSQVQEIHPRVPAGLVGRSGRTFLPTLRTKSERDLRSHVEAPLQCPKTPTLLARAPIRNIGVETLVNLIRNVDPNSSVHSREGNIKGCFPSVRLAWSSSPKDLNTRGQTLIPFTPSCPRGRVSRWTMSLLSQERGHGRLWSCRDPGRESGRGHGP